MQAVKEFWVGVFSAALGIFIGFGYAQLLGPPDFLPNVLQDMSNFTLFMGLVGFILGATGTQIWQEGFPRWARQYFGIDLRSLAVLRIGLGAIIILDIWMRARDLTAHYTDDGILPLKFLTSKSVLSLHVLSGEPWVQMMLFVTTALFAFLLMVGYRTRLMTIICWFLMMSLHCRNPLIQTGGDAFLRMMLFWSMFLPLGARYSIDSALNVSFSKRCRRIADAATFALLVQLACVYGFSGVLKTHPNWTTHGTAAYYALSLDMLTTPIAKYLIEFPMMLKASTFGVLYLERFAPLLIFFPWRNGIIRTFMFAVLFTMHFSFEITMYLGMFPLVGMLSTFAYLPSSAWDWLTGFVKKRQLRVRIYYDQRCGFCRKMVLLTRTALLLPRARIRRGNTKPDIDKVIRKQQTWVVIDSAGNHCLRFDGFLTLLRASYVFRPLGWVLSWTFFSVLGNSFYQFVAHRRSFFGHCTRFLNIRRWKVRTYWPLQPLVIAFLIYVFLHNLTNLPGHSSSWFTNTRTKNEEGKTISQRRWFFSLGKNLRLDQNWQLFGPKPLENDGWFVMEGVFVNDPGSSIDVRTGKRISRTKPDNVASTFINNRWRKFLEKVAAKNKWAGTKTQLCSYLCREWNRNHSRSEQLERVRLWFHQERTRLPGVKQKVIRINRKGCWCKSAWPDPSKKPAHVH